ncbi:pentatricopeptide repeat-containing protein At3g26630, chloroplastic-like [Vicia villosa]|uniref:pentatricopeptide repeat-containing protein At3g26630, chloroplastic-like n=1 Tax=Vicia villosa TaxID=3911 RepID=UPI00273C5A61|nr:pentatricopeptide repeat-containing protein At3g26630, chloroplastic-like [Vicia villosa]
MKLSCHTPHAKIPQEPTFSSDKARFFLQNCNNFKQLKQIHARIIRFGLTHDQLLIRKLCQFSSSYGKVDYASLVFDQLDSPDTFTWNVMIRACNTSGSPEKAIFLFKEMYCHGFETDKFTYPFVLNACIASGFIDFGRVVHGVSIKMGFWSDVYVQNNMMNLYFKCGRDVVEDGWKVFDRMRVRNVVSWTTVIAGLVGCGKLDAAREVFEKMGCKNVVSWTAMIDGYVKCGNPIMAFDLFERMLLANVRPNEFTLVSLIKACTDLGSLKLGRRMHDFALKNGFEVGPFLGTALIDMYSKCGSLDNAVRVFGLMQVRNLATWNTMITSIGVHGFREEVLDLFEEMERANVVPDAITFVGVLSACVQMNDLEKGYKYFSLMTEHYGITPIFEHYTCIVELYVRANELNEIGTLGNTMSLSMKESHYVAELLQESKLTSIDDIKKFIHKHYTDSDLLELVLDHSATPTQPYFNRPYLTSLS